MDFSLTDEQRIAIDSFRRFLEAEIAPAIAEFDDAFIPKDHMRELLGSLLPFGMGNGLVDEAHGGLGLDPLTVGLLFEELARVSPDLAIVVLIQMEAGLLLAAGSESIRANYLAPLLSGEKFACIGISEPEAGSNIAQIRCRARRDGSGFLLSGENSGYPAATTRISASAWPGTRKAPVMALACLSSIGKRVTRAATFPRWPSTGNQPRSCTSTTHRFPLGICWHRRARV